MDISLRGSAAEGAAVAYLSTYAYIYTDTDEWTDPVFAIWNDTRFTAIAMGVTVKLTHTMADGGLTETVNNASGKPFGTGLTLPFTYRQEASSTYTGAPVGYRHFVRFADFTDGLLAAITSAAGFTYASLTGDRAYLEITVTGTRTDGKTITGTYTANVYRVPDHTITSIALDSPNTVAINYYATTGWNRGDNLDNAVLKSFTVNGVEALKPRFGMYSRTSGLGHQYGKLFLLRGVGVNALDVWPQVGDTVSATVRTYGDRLYTYTGVLENQAVCDTPEYDYWLRDGYIEVNPWQSGDMGYTGTELFTVSLVGGVYPEDTVTGIPDDGTAILYPPLDVPCTYVITGYSEDGDVSASVEFSATLPSNGLVYIGDGLTMRYNMSYRDDRSAEAEHVKLARELPSVFYGTGLESANVRLSGDIDRSEQDSDAFRALARDISLYRIPGGRRAYCAVKTVQVTEHALYDTISLNLYEVAR